MRLKWKLRLYYAVLLLALLGLLATATGAIVLREFRLEMGRREQSVLRVARRVIDERLAAVDSEVSRLARDPRFLALVERDLVASRDETIAAWAPLATQLLAEPAAPQADEPTLTLLKILDGEGFVLSSAHWPDSYGLRDSPGLILALEREFGARLARERDGDGEFMALVAPRWEAQTRRYVLVGGVRADSTLERELSDRCGVPLRFELRAAGAGAGDSLAGLSVAAAPVADASWVPLRSSPDELRGGLHLLFDRSSVRELTLRLAQIFGLATLAGMVLAWILGLWISNRVTRPLERLTDGVAELATGRTPRAIEMQGSGEVRELVRGFNHMAESLAESRERLRRVERIAAWRDVARRIAHEIKNALAPIQLSVESVARSVHTGRGNLETLVDESVTMVRGEVEGLRRLVNSFNEFARLPEPEMAPHRLEETWERVAAAFEPPPQLESQGLESLPTLRYDEDQIRRALHNLVRNAAEAGAERVLLSAGRVPTGFELRLHDDGPGIPAEDLPQVFEPYFTRKSEGTGLGLAIVYKICTDHGWTVSVQSPLGSQADGRRGTAFTIRIPASAVTHEELPHAG